MADEDPENRSRRLEEMLHQMLHHLQPRGAPEKAAEEKKIQWSHLHINTIVKDFAEKKKKRKKEKKEKTRLYGKRI